MPKNDGNLNLEAPDEPRKWSLPFLGRVHELALFKKFIEADSSQELRRLIIQGDSGTGKSYFVRKAAFDCLQEQSNEYFCLYVDLSNDEFQSSRLISSLLKLSLLPAEPSLNYPISVPKEATLEEFKRVSTDRKSIGWNVIKGLSQVAASFVGMGEAAKEVLNGAGEAATSADDVLAEYLKWAKDSRTVVLIIDNYQFMNHEVRLTLESILSRIGKNIRFVVVDRTIDGISEVTPPLQKLSEHDQSVSLSGFNLDETRAVVHGAIVGDDAKLDGLAADIFIKTKGLPKDVEYCLRHYVIASEGSSEKVDVSGLLATIDRLPLMHRQFLMIAALLDGGIDQKLASNVVRRVGSIPNDIDIERTLSDLIANEYLKLNSDTGTRLRAGHERIVQSMREVAKDDNFDDVRRSLIEEFASCLESKTLPDNEAYILHCLVGVQTASELRGNLHFISRLVKTQHRLDQFAYLVSLSEEIGELVPLLPENTINLLLDSMQKTSAFERGLQLVRVLEDNDALSNQERVLSRFKFLTQLYQYEEANKLLSDLPDDLWSQVYKISGLISQDRYEEAKTSAAAALSAPDMNEAKAILLRNTITLQSPEDALKNLHIASDYFKEIDSEFRLGTIDTNRSFVHLCMRNYGEAARVLERSIMLMKRVGSREIYQAYFNRAIQRGLSGNFALASEDFERASEVVPPTLLLDQVKIEMAQVIFRLLSNEIDDSQALETLKKLLAKIKGVQLPYLRRSLEQNIATLENQKTEIAPKIKAHLASSERISIYLPVAYQNSSTLIVNPSIHLRY